MDIHSWNTAACEDWWRSDLSYVNDQQCLLYSQAVEEGREVSHNSLNITEPKYS